MAEHIGALWADMIGDQHKVILIMHGHLYCRRSFLKMSCPVIKAEIFVNRVSSLGLCESLPRVRQAALVFPQRQNRP